MINRSVVEAFLHRVGQKCESNSSLFLLGGTALELLGGSRPTLDLDYVGSDTKFNDLQNLMDTIAQEMHLEIEAVPIDEFVPTLPDADKRVIFVGQFGQLAVYIVDPYTIALSKIDRGFDTDIEDVCFLIRHQFIETQQFEQFLEIARKEANRFDLDPAAMQQHWQSVRDLL